MSVIAVILYHAGLPGFAGGYVGVDVFFVISGFLIAGIITEELAGGVFTFAGFYERRVRRILPALLVVLGASTLGAFYWLPPSGLVKFALGAAASATMVANLYFWRTSGYFGPTAQESPLLHTWSLGVEEQFYLFFPALLAGTWAFRRRQPLLLAGLALASIGLAEWGWRTHPGAAFYLLPTRFWELMLGALVLHAAPTLGTVRPAARRLGQWVAALALIAAIVLYRSSTPFPGLYALLPTGAAALLIGLGGTGATPVERLLGSRALVGVGLVSYSAYLWHQPLLVFARARQLEPLSPAATGAAIALAFLLAYATWRFVERPFRERGRIPRARVFAATGAGVALFFGLGVRTVLGGALGGRIRVPASVSRAFDGRYVISPECLDRSGPGPGDPVGCGVGPAGAPVRFLVIGDSHARALLPAVRALADSEGLAGRVVSLSACPPLLEWRVGIANRDRACATLNQRVLDFAVAHHVPEVVLVARWESYVAWPRHWTWELPWSGAAQVERADSEDAVRRTVAGYGAHGIALVVLRQVPRQRALPEHIYAVAFTGGDPSATLRRAAPTLDEYAAGHRFDEALFDSLARSGTLRVAGLEGRLCAGGSCVVGTPEVSYYFDDNHLSEDGARYVEPELRVQLGLAALRRRTAPDPLDQPPAP